MRGTVTEVTDGQDGRKVAQVQLENGESAQVAYWPELLEQWGADKLRAYLVHQAVEAAAGAQVEDPHQALLGDAEAAPVETPPAPAVCNLGAAGCVVDHDLADADQLAAPAHQAAAVQEPA